MDRSTEGRLRASLAAALDTWLENVADRGELGAWLGDNTPALMADAALAVLLGIADAQAAALRDGYLDESEESDT